MCARGLKSMYNRSMLGRRDRQEPEALPVGNKPGRNAEMLSNSGQTLF